MTMSKSALSAILSVIPRVILMSIPAVGTLSAQGVPLTSTDRPVWAVEGVPDSVWMLVEESGAAATEDATRALLERAEAHARAALEGHADDTGRRFGLAAVLGSRADVEVGFTKVQIGAEFNREVDAVLALDPEHAGARHLLGRLYAGLLRSNELTQWIAQNLMGGGEREKPTWEAAEEHLVFAEERAPDVLGHHLQLAALYADTDRAELALQELEHVLQRPAVHPLESAEQEQALEMKAELEKKLKEEANRPPR